MTDRDKDFARLRRAIDLASDPHTRAHKVAWYSRRAASLAEKLGVIFRPVACEACKTPEAELPEKLSRHHENHALPIEVNYLCKACHEIADRRLATRAAMGRCNDRRR